MPDILIFADDLSGAADCAAGCAVAGLETVVLLGPSPAPGAASRTASTVAVDLNSRDLSADASGQALYAAMREALRVRTGAIYLKIDSTLRGNWPTDLMQARRAVMDVAGAPPLAIIAPAFPALGRVTRDGRVLVGDGRLGQTSGRIDARVAGDLLQAMASIGLAVRYLPIGVVQEGPDCVARVFREMAAAGGEAAVCDAETDHDLGSIAAGGLAAETQILWMGSAGLMRQLAPYLSKGRRPDAAPARVPGPRLFVAGSAAPIGHTQFARLLAAGEVMPITLTPEELLEHREESGQRLDLALEAGIDVTVQIAAGAPTSAATSQRLVSALAAVIVPRLGKVSALFATGGATARAILETATVAGISVGGEIEPGVPWGRTMGEMEIPIVIKAGAFGDPDTLLRVQAALKG